MAPPKGFRPANKIDRAGVRYGKLVAIKDEGNGRWFCNCDCGNTVSVLSTNFANYAKSNRGCGACRNRLNIAGERVGLLVAVSTDLVPTKGEESVWTFKCDCGGSVQGAVKDFRFGRLRSCGCIDDAFSSWQSMMKRCYDKNNNRYNSYGGRGIKVCDRWHKFGNFIDDMGERPKGFNLSRQQAEGDYSPDNCCWESINLNCRDTKNDGMPTKPGMLKGAKPRNK